MYIEEAEESPRFFFLNQVKYLVEPYDVDSKAKYKEVIALLSKRPQLVIIGEAQGKLHFKALYHAIATGLQCMSTAHATSVNSLIVRIRYIYGIPLEKLPQLPIVVLMKKEDSMRRVAGIYRLVVKGCEIVPINYELYELDNDSRDFMCLMSRVLRYAIGMGLFSPIKLSYFLDEFYREVGIYEIPKGLK